MSHCATKDQATWRAVAEVGAAMRGLDWLRLCNTTERVKQRADESEGFRWEYQVN